jgi:diguanylate cyclase (GGDEF)-like protein
MNAARSSTTSHDRRFDSIPSRTPRRVAVALLVVLVAAAGAWTLASAYDAARASSRAKQLEAGYQSLRYAVALERSAVRDSDAREARRETASASASFADGLRVVRRSGGTDDLKLAAALTTTQRTLAGAAARVVAAAVRGDAQRASTLRRTDFEPRATAADKTLSQALTRARTDSGSRWSGSTLEKIELAGIAALLLVGLAGCLGALARLVGRRRRQGRTRRDAVTRLTEAALTDSLTGLGNHRAFHEDVRREIERRVRTGSTFGLVMLDLDGLKQINDSLGHQVGDACIRAVAECIRATMRGADAAYRTGGDEFIVLLPNERAWGAFTFAQRFQREVEDHPTELAVSCGVAESSAFESTDTLVRRVDMALYDAKRSGRRIVIYGDDLSPKQAPAADRATRRHHRELATALAHAVDAKHAGSRDHCETVSTLCVLIAQARGLDGPRTERLRLAGLLHDVGKIAVADAILQKPGPLDEDEWMTMREHVSFGHKIVTAAELDDAAHWVLHHHEHVDGTGYPDALEGEEIPLESRIILVADAFEAMTATRPYRAALPVEAAVGELARGSGKQFDPACVDGLQTALAIAPSLPVAGTETAPEKNSLSNTQVTAA